MRLACELRPYQREGIAWLAFLRRTGLHGCLADDMGLGKTLQATAIIAGHPEKRKEKTTPFGINLMTSQVLCWAAQQVSPAILEDTEVSDTAFVYLLSNNCQDM